MRILTLIVFILFTGFVQATDSPMETISVIHLDPTGEDLEDPPFKYMYYYRTEVRNDSTRPLKIVWFEGYENVEGVWNPNNVLRRALRGADFSNWYTEGAKIVDGVIPPGEVAACDVNWHGSNKSGLNPIKWAYISVDDQGNEYYVEAEVPAHVIRSVSHATANKAN